MMKTKFFTFLIAIIASTGAILASDTQVDGIWYDFENSTQTASVTYHGSSSGDYSNEYSGDIIIPSSVTYNGIPYSVTSIGEGAFYNCSGLTSIEIPEGVTSIGNSAFGYCSGLTSMTCKAVIAPSFAGIDFRNVDKSIPLYVPAESINAYQTADGWYVFTNILPIEEDPCLITSGTCGENLTWELSCDSVLTISGTGEMDTQQQIPWQDYKNVIKSVIINEGATSIGYGAFVEFIGMTSIEIPNSVTSIGYAALNFCTSLTSVTIPNSITSIGDYAFAYSGLTSINIPNSVTSVGELAFFDCNSLISIDVDEENPNYSSVEGVLYNKNKTTLIQYPSGRQGECVIPYSVTSIEIFAFYNCIGLTSITCEVVTPPALASDVFYEVNKSIPLYVPAESIEAYKAADQWRDFTNIQPIGNPVIFLDYNSIVLSNQYVRYGMRAKAPDVPAREGYTFVGWNVDIEHIIAPTYAIALYEKIGGTVTYLSEEGYVIASENVDLHLPSAPIIAGKSFKGWLTESADADGIVLRATYTSDNPTTNDNVTVTPTSNSADVSFPFITGALTYELVIRDQSGNVVCKIMFNSSGQLLGIAFAPSRNRNQQQATQSIGFNFTVEGLNANTTYSYEFVAYDETDEVIENLSGSFTTTDETPTNINNTPASNTPQKYILDGSLFIEYNNRTFDARGQQVK